MSTVPTKHALPSLIELAEANELRIYTDVPVTGPEAGGWAAEGYSRIVHIGVSGVGPGGVEAYGRDQLAHALEVGATAHPISVTTSLDRTLLGFHATREAYVARTWAPKAPLEPIAVVTGKGGRSNVTNAFEAAGIRIWPAPPEARSGSGPATGGRDSGGRRDPWSRRSTRDREDALLFDLRKQRSEPAWWLAELPVGWVQSPRESKARRIDAVVIPWPEPRTSRQGQSLDEFAAAAPHAAEVELIEAKHELNADTVGQLLAAAHMFPATWKTAAPLILTACVDKPGDTAVQWLCRQGLPGRWRIERIHVALPGATGTP